MSVRDFPLLPRRRAVQITEPRMNGALTNQLINIMAVTVIQPSSTAAAHTVMTTHPANINTATLSNDK
ncbi:hypothetical protein KACC15558_35100 [Brevibacterium ammoniilyticum]|uniref:Uncharacterized protein n=1 Tax=Brevibacterium ammoniilyticum TaxID=1046555 RepID=A0ABP9U8R3_9MICO